MELSPLESSLTHAYLMYIENIYCKYRLIPSYQIKNINVRRALKSMDGCFFIK